MAGNTTASGDAGAPPVTEMLARFVASHPSRGWDDGVEREAHRTLLNWMGCAIGAAEHPATRAALDACLVLQPTHQATLLGRRERVDIASAALINGIASHVFDYDDTHLKSLVNPAGPVAPALLALAELTGASGRQVIDALVIGVEVSCRVGSMLCPQHDERGWHVTGSTGMLGSAAACARLLGLDEQHTTMALGIAASQPVGLREQFGSMSKSLHAGAAAHAGLMAALMAREGFSASPRAIEAPHGLVQAVSTRSDWTAATLALGERFEIAQNTFKPHACSVFIHPAIEACARLREQGVQAAEVQGIALRVHPRVLERCGKAEPADGLAAKFSVHHGCSVGLIFGRAGEAEFADNIVARDDVLALRRKVSAAADAQVAEDAVHLVARLADGRVVDVHVEHTIGSPARPMNDAALAAKFHDLVDPVLGAARADELIAVVRGAAALPTLWPLLQDCRP